MGMYNQLNLNCAVPENDSHNSSCGNVNGENCYKPVDGMATLFSEKAIEVFL